jgi:hypothetical protein
MRSGFLADLLKTVTELFRNGLEVGIVVLPSWRGDYGRIESPEFCNRICKGIISSGNRGRCLFTCKGYGVLRR